MRRIHLLLLGLLVLALLPAEAQAAEPRQGDTVVVGPDETINDDLYAVGGTITIQGIVNGDVVAAGGTITISGVMNGDVAVGGDVRAEVGTLRRTQQATV